MSPLNCISEKKLSEKELLSQENKLDELPTINIKNILQQACTPRRSTRDGQIKNVKPQLRN